MHFSKTFEVFRFEYYYPFFVVSLLLPFGKFKWLMVRSFGLHTSRLIVLIVMIIYFLHCLHSSLSRKQKNKYNKGILRQPNEDKYHSVCVFVVLIVLIFLYLFMFWQ